MGGKEGKNYVVMNCISIVKKGQSVPILLSEIVDAPRKWPIIGV